MPANLLLLDEVTKGFGGVTAVDGVSAELQPGAIYGFLGPNGAGKTTTIRMVMDIFRPDSGRIELFGGLPPSRAKDRIGYMPEERGMYRKMKAADFLVFIGRLKGMSSSAAEESARRLLAELDLEARAESKVEEYSRGMQQKLQFAATAINDPELLILDEPFSGLDPVNLDAIKEMILARRDSGATVVFSTHMMEHAERLCDRILLIHRGRKVIDGTLEEIRSRGVDNVLVVETSVDSRRLAEIEGVERVDAGERGAQTVTLAEGGSPRAFLAGLVELGEVRSFRVRTPTLHEVFVQLATDRGDADAG